MNRWCDPSSKAAGREGVLCTGEGVLCTGHVAGCDQAACGVGASAMTSMGWGALTGGTMAAPKRHVARRRE